ncbi:hypothetical protein QBC47DRAFT_360440 [Echria macrotheca]|uniref:Uncharacterized protein n=1 Tax=Echria macrotheca TaxID=438768 RepID=A0AAJ0BDZ0_9PEZI|nr:hypothetical protein QBC47DRAFT_360440 [Echria macrotheca]
MHSRHLALLLGAAATLTTPATAQLPPELLGTSERLPPFTPLHTAIYTTALTPSNKPSQVITTVVVTLLVPRSGSTVTGTAVSHFSAAGQSTWTETSRLVWTVAGINEGQQQQQQNASEPMKPTTGPPLVITGVYTDYSHYTTLLLGAWNRVHYDYRTTVRETIMEEIDAAYPATIVRTGYSTLEATALVYEDYYFGAGYWSTGRLMPAVDMDELEVKEG